MTTDNELKPCGCGGIAGERLRQMIGDRPASWFQCDKCGLRTADYETPQESRAAWNRALSAPPPAVAPQGWQADYDAALDTADALLEDDTPYGNLARAYKNMQVRCALKDAALGWISKKAADKRNPAISFVAHKALMNEEPSPLRTAPEKSNG